MIELGALFCSENCSGACSARGACALDLAAGRRSPRLAGVLALVLVVLGAEIFCCSGEASCACGAALSSISLAAALVVLLVLGLVWVLARRREGAVVFDAAGEAAALSLNSGLLSAGAPVGELSAASAEVALVLRERVVLLAGALAVFVLAVLLSLALLGGVEALSVGFTGLSAFLVLVRRGRLGVGELSPAGDFCVSSVINILKKIKYCSHIMPDCGLAC